MVNMLHVSFGSLNSDFCKQGNHRIVFFTYVYFNFPCLLTKHRMASLGLLYHAVLICSTRTKEESSSSLALQESVVGNIIEVLRLS